MEVRNRIVEIKDVPGNLIRPNPKNWRLHPEGQVNALKGILAEVGIVDVLKVVPHPSEPGAYMLVDGHARAEILGDQPVKVAVLDLSQTEQKLILATFDPIGALADKDQDMLDSLIKDLKVDGIDLSDLGWSGEDLLELLPDSGGDGDGNDGEGGDNLYTQKIEAPIYKITGKKPEISELFDHGKSTGLLDAINQADIPDEDKRFLRQAAQRHVVFNYHNIAEYYAHASPSLQRLMEDSALVIIDYNRAIELGYVKVSDALDGQRRREYPDEE